MTPSHLVGGPVAPSPAAPLLRSRCGCMTSSSRALRRAARFRCVWTRIARSSSVCTRHGKGMGQANKNGRSGLIEWESRIGCRRSSTSFHVYAFTHLLREWANKQKVCVDCEARKLGFWLVGELVAYRVYLPGHAWSSANSSDSLSCPLGIGTPEL